MTKQVQDVPIFEAERVLECGNTLGEGEFQRLLLQEGGRKEGRREGGGRPHRNLGGKSS